ncbi:hypothetical protein ALC60_06777 [Trachymyrmex zeteki]|uniref:Uncharacterized protein n=1 Tax=Mycetomoellerius zeteki TaxID=64791 RepID=A0A151X1D9_9HYME|nr:hypothetical protein ALC60_06777 [Trachymyrmex zeteki]
MISERNFIGFPSDFADSAYKTRTENVSRNCRRFFREVPASDDDEECAFTCLSRATGEYNEQRKGPIKDEKEEELCGIYTQRKEVEVRQGRLLRKVECECADIERTPNRLLEVTWPAGWLRRQSQPASRRDSQLGQPTWGVSLRPQGPQERRAVRTERDRGMQDGCAGGGEKMRGNREREGKVGAARRDLRLRRKCCIQDIYTYTVIQKSRRFFRYLVTVVSIRSPVSTLRN